MFAWFSDLTPRERRTMGACFGGWSLDALDVQIFSFVIPSLLALWKISTGQAGELATITLLVSAFGGWIAGAMCRSLGPRARASDHHRVVRLLHLPVRLRAGLHPALHLPRAARLGLRRRMGRGRRADGRGDPGQLPRPRRRPGADRLVDRLGRRGAALHHPDRRAAGGIRLAHAVLDRPPSRRPGVLDPPLRRGTGNPPAPRARPRASGTSSPR